MQADQARAGPFAPPELPGFDATMDPSESLLTSRTVMHSRPAWSHEPGQQGIPGSDAFLRHPPSDLTPESWTGARSDAFPAHAGFDLS